MRDPLRSWGARVASAAAIKSAYRQAARSITPQHKNDPKAAARFSEINSANEINWRRGQKQEVSTAAKIDAEGMPVSRVPAANRGGGGFENHTFAPRRRTGGLGGRFRGHASTACSRRRARGRGRRRRQYLSARPAG